MPDQAAGDQDKWAQRLAYAAITAAIFRGFINLVPTGALGLATVVIDGVMVVMLGTFVFLVIKGARIEIWMWLVGIVVLVTAALLPNGNEGLGVQLNALRGQAFYASAGLYLAIALKSASSIDRIVSFFMRAGLIVALYGCLQFVFRSYLPPALLYPSDTNLFGYYGTDITRSTGLVGNSIVFGSLLTLVFSLWAAKLMWHPSLTTAVGCVGSALGVLSTLSRMAIGTSVAVFLALAVVSLFTRGARRALVVSGFCVAGLVLGALVLGLSPTLQRSVTESFLWQELLLGNNASVIGSTDTHYAFQTLALEVLRDHPLVGIGIGSQSFDSANAQSQQIITDGFWLATSVEGGLILLIPTIALFLSLFVRLFAAVRRTDAPRRFLPLAVIAYLASQALAAGFFNTGFYGKVPNVAFWIVFGCSVALSRVRTAAVASRGTALSALTIADGKPVRASL